MLILQREGLGMYLCLINGGGGKSFAANKRGVISQRCLLGKLTGSPHRDTTENTRTQGNNSLEACLCGRTICSHSFSAVYMCCRVGGVCFHEPHTIINSTSTCDNKCWINLSLEGEITVWSKQLLLLFNTWTPKSNHVKWFKMHCVV